MAEQRFFIGPPNSGLQRDVKSWIIADDAYEKLRNAYVWRSILKKRVGSQLLVDNNPLLSRLRVNLGGQTGADTWSYSVTAADAAAGQMFSLGTTTYYVPTTGTPVTLLTDSGTVITATFNTTTGAVVINDTGPGAVNLYWYPNLPVMGLITYNTDNINDEFPIAFDTRHAYKRDASAWERLATGDATWTGTNSDFFWGANYRADTADQNVLFVTNFVEADGIRIYNDEAVTINSVAKAAETWTKFTFTYSASANTDIITAKLIFYFKDRLILLNVKEQAGSASTVHFPNRCRYSQNGSPFQSNAWYQAPEAYGKGGFIDAPTEQAIVTAQFLRDRLIVYFERSTYELVYTGNKVLPFVWQKINTELGAESTFSQVPFDDVVLGVGNVGIHACDGASVQRIDDKIPQEVFRVRNQESGLIRVAGIRDYRIEMVYWTFPAEPEIDNTSVFPNRLLAYNYKNNSWAFFDDSITAFGYWQRDTTIESPIWQNIGDPWYEIEGVWGRGANQLKERFVLAGNQQGYTFLLDGSLPTNAEALQISNFDDTTNLMTIYDHNLTNQDYVYVTQMTGVTSLEGQIFQISVINNNSFSILNRTPGSDTYTGAGVIARVSPIEAWTKDFNFFNQVGRNVAINRVEFYIDVTPNGEITVSTISTDSDVYDAEQASGTVLAPILGTSILETKRFVDEPFPNRERSWRSVFFSSDGESIQLRFYMTPTQITTPTISRTDFQLNAMIVYAQATADR